MLSYESLRISFPSGTIHSQFIIFTLSAGHCGLLSFPVTCCGGLYCQLTRYQYVVRLLCLSGSKSNSHSLHFVPAEANSCWSQHFCSHARSSPTTCPQLGWGTSLWCIQLCTWPVGVSMSWWSKAPVALGIPQTMSPTLLSVSSCS